MHITMNSRRRFLRNATGVVATGLVSGSALGQTLVPAAEKKSSGPFIMRTLGRTGLKIPIVSMGVMNSSNPNLVKVAWQNGMRHFDTAWIYQRGNNELMVGRVMKELGINRSDLVLTTKVLVDGNLRTAETADARRRQMLERFSESLQRLEMDYVDILMYHDVKTVDEVNDPVVLEVMQQLKNEGKIRFSAFSTHVYWPEQLRLAADKGFFDVALISINYAMANDTASLQAMDYAASKGMGLIAMKTQCQQDWYKGMLPAEAQQFYEGGVMHSALLKWVLRHESITTAVPGFTTFEQMQTDLEVGYNLDYTTEERKFLEDHHVKIALQSVCRFCGGCTGTCPQGVDIPSLMRTHMYAISYGNLHMTRQALEDIQPGRGLSVCNDCEECTAVCTSQVQIAQRIGEMQQLIPVV